MTLETTMLRRRGVRALTGWSNCYIDKLRRTGVLRTWHPGARSQHWYFKSQIEELLAGAKPQPKETDL